MSATVYEERPAWLGAVQGWKSHEMNRITRQARARLLAGQDPNDILQWVLAEFIKLDSECDDIKARWVTIGAFVGSGDEAGYVAWERERFERRHFQRGSSYQWTATEDAVYREKFRKM